MSTNNSGSNVTIVIIIIGILLAILIFVLVRRKMDDSEAADRVKLSGTLVSGTSGSGTPISGAPVNPPVSYEAETDDTEIFLAGVTDRKYAMTYNCRICSKCETLVGMGHSKCPVCGNSISR